jgi:flagellar biosynthesis/type III secretory pathway chaperone
MRALRIGLMVLGGLMGIALVGITSPASPPNKVVIGVLDFETSGPYVERLGEQKKILMKELRRNTRVKLVDIRESCSFSDLKRHGYEQAERYRNNYQLDMVLHTDLISGYPHRDYYIKLIDLYTKQVKEASIETTGDVPIELRFRGVSKKLLVSKDLNRVLSEKKKVLAKKKEVAVPQELKKEMIAKERGAKEIPPPVTSINKVVVGVLDFETSGFLEEKKKVLMKELRRNTRVKLVDIRESCSFSDLKRHGYERAERYKDIYHLDMILHSYHFGSSYYFSLIDLYTKGVKEVSIEGHWREPVELGLRGVSKKLLVSKDLNRVLKAKKKALEEKEEAVTREVKESPKEKVLGKKEVTVTREVKRSPEEIEGFLIQDGPRLIAEDQYNRVLELIEDLPSKNRKHVQIKTLACFANLKGYLSEADKLKKLHWWTLWKKLIDSGDNEATPMLTVILRDNDPGVRRCAAELLGHIGDNRALNTLREVGENDEHFRVRRYAKWAYEQISGEKF